MAERICEGLKELFEDVVLVAGPGKVVVQKLLNDVEFMAMGAEACIFKAKYMGMECVVKWRQPKPYMPHSLDAEFRRQRTEMEAKALWKALSIGIRVPIPLYVSLDNALIVMSFVRGLALRDLEESLKDSELCGFCERVGEYVAKLHSVGLAHGDLSTSNILISPPHVYLIDFGLVVSTKKVEDKAIDIHIFFRGVESAHHRREGLMKRCFIEGYSKVAGGEETARLLKLVEDIRKRGRYVAARRLRSEWQL